MEAKGLEKDLIYSPKSYFEDFKDSEEDRTIMNAAFLGRGSEDSFPLTYLKEVIEPLGEEDPARVERLLRVLELGKAL